MLRFSDACILFFFQNFKNTQFRNPPANHPSHLQGAAETANQLAFAANIGDNYVGWLQVVPGTQAQSQNVTSTLLLFFYFILFFHTVAARARVIISDFNTLRPEAKTVLLKAFDWCKKPLEALRGC